MSSTGTRLRTSSLPEYARRGGFEPTLILSWQRYPSPLKGTFFPSQTLKGSGGILRHHLDRLAAFLAGAQVGVTKWWIENDMRYSPQEVAKMHFFLALFGMR
jgi:hypothetical protein